jgi:hypothetical protein
MHINCRRKNEQAAAVYHLVCRDAGTDMAHDPVCNGDIGYPPVRKADILQYEGGTHFHSIHFFSKGIKTWGLIHNPENRPGKNGRTNSYSIRIMQYSIIIYRQAAGRHLPRIRPARHRKKRSEHG